MLNYIWAGLIALSLGFALWADVGEMRRDVYRNGGELPVTLKFAKPYDPNAEQAAVEVVIDPADYGRFYGVEAKPAASYAGTYVVDKEKGEKQLRFAKGVDLPAPLSTIRDVTGVDKELRPSVGEVAAGATTAQVLVRFDPVRFVKMRAIGAAATEFAGTAVTVAIGLIGILALWLGLMQIAEKSGLIDLVVKLIQPILHPLFPEIPKGHPALGMIALNLSANMLGLGNAATPMGIKAMQELQKLNKSKDTATNSMVMLLALNTAGVQLMPPATLVAIMGMQTARIYFPVLFVTGICAVIAIGAAKLLGKVGVFRRSDPALLPDEVQDVAETGA